MEFRHIRVLFRDITGLDFNLGMVLFRDNLKLDFILSMVIIQTLYRSVPL